MGPFQSPSGDHGPPCVVTDHRTRITNFFFSETRLSTQGHQSLVALKLPAEDRGDVEAGVEVAVEDPTTDTLAVLGPPAFVVLVWCKS